MTQQITRDGVMQAVRDLVTTDKRDAAGGGVAIATLEGRLPASRSRVRSVVGKLERSGRLVRVEGLHHETGKPRQSYLPAGHPDAPGDETPRTLAEVRRADD